MDEVIISCPFLLRDRILLRRFLYARFAKIGQKSPMFSYAKRSSANGSPSTFMWYGFEPMEFATMLGTFLSVALGGVDSTAHSCH